MCLPVVHMDPWTWLRPCSKGKGLLQGLEQWEVCLLSPDTPPASWKDSSWWQARVASPEEGHITGKASLNRKAQGERVPYRSHTCPYFTGDLGKSSPCCSAFGRGA